VLCGYAGDALWVLALALMFSASLNAWRQTADRQTVRFLGGPARREVAFWLLPVASFALSIWLALKARGVDNEAAIILFGIRAVAAPLLAVVHLRWVGDALKP
jgi:FtsH-binding integral membrane protein